MTNQTPVVNRLRFKHAMTATAMALVQMRNTWKLYFAGLAAERKEVARQQQKGWGG